MAKNPLIRSYPRRVSKPPPNKSAGILDDFAVRKVVATKEGSITRSPVDDIDITNKKYVDDLTTDHPHQDVNTTATPTFEGASMGSEKITSVATPTAGTDAATKQYVDDSVTPVENSAASISTTVGNRTGTVSDVITKNDGNEYKVDEVAATPAIVTTITFEDVEAFNSIQSHNFYDGPHIVNIQLWNYDSEDWDTIASISSQSALTDTNIVNIDDANYIEDEIVLVRYYHPDMGNASDDLLIDYCAVWNSFGGGTGAKLWESDA